MTMEKRTNNGYGSTKHYTEH